MEGIFRSGCLAALFSSPEVAIHDAMQPIPVIP
jgi:hypothetical protein